MEIINETSDETLISNNKYQGMSQIEKFNARFGNNSPYIKTLKP